MQAEIPHAKVVQLSLSSSAEVRHTSNPFTHRVPHHERQKLLETVLKMWACKYTQGDWKHFVGAFVLLS